MVEEETTQIGDDRPRTVAQLLDLIARERGALEQAVANMDDDDLESPTSGWTAKDHLAHVAAWERRLIGEMQGDRAAERFGLDEAAYGATNTDDFNAMLHERFKDNSPATVRAEFHASGETLRATLAGLSDADLQQPVRPDDPGVDTLVELIAWDTFRHYPEHVTAITGQV